MGQGAAAPCGSRAEPWPFYAIGSACAFVVILMLLFWSGQAEALESGVVGSDRAQASLVTEVESYVPGAPFRVGLRLRLAPGWHSYWVNPGDCRVPRPISC